MQKSMSSYSHSRNSSNYSAYNPHNSVNSPPRFDAGMAQTLNSCFRAGSPSSKMKIRLVSPLKDKGSVLHQPKENHPPVTIPPANIGKNSVSI
jgi:hypothetical protein